MERTQEVAPNPEFGSSLHSDLWSRVSTSPLPGTAEMGGGGGRGLKAGVHVPFPLPNISKLIKS